MQALLWLCRLVVIVLVAGSSLIEPAWGTAFSTDNSDIWGTLNEDG